MKVNIWAECFKMARRREAQAGLLVFAILPTLLIISLRFSENVTFASEKMPINLTTASLAFMLSTFLAPMLVVVVTAGSLARERQTGEIRLVLLQPHKRSVILGSKAIALTLYIVLVLLITLLAGLTVSIILFDTSQFDLTLTSQAPETAGGLLLMFTIAAMGLVSLMTITLSLATYFSYGVTLMITFTLLVLMGILGEFEQVKPYLLTYAWNAINYTKSSNANAELLHALLALAGYMIVGIGSAFLLFERRDITS